MFNVKDTEGRAQLLYAPVVQLHANIIQLRTLYITRIAQSEHPTYPLLQQSKGWQIKMEHL